jgi:hypothetical protein
LLRDSRFCLVAAFGVATVRSGDHGRGAATLAAPRLATLLHGHALAEQPPTYGLGPWGIYADQVTTGLAHNTRSNAC